MKGKRKEVKIYHANLMKPFFEREEIVFMTLHASEEETLQIPSLSGVSGTETVDDVMRKAVKTEELEPAQIEGLKQVLTEFQEVFPDRPGKTTWVTHDIELTSDQPVRAKPYRVSPRQRNLIKTEIDKMLELGVIKPGESDYTFPLIMVEVPGKNPRPCIDISSTKLDNQGPNLPDTEHRGAYRDSKQC